MNFMRNNKPFAFEAFHIILFSILVGTLLTWLAHLLHTSKIEKNNPGSSRCSAELDKTVESAVNKRMLIMDATLSPAEIKVSIRHQSAESISVAS